MTTEINIQTEQPPLTDQLEEEPSSPDDYVSQTMELPQAQVAIDAAGQLERGTPIKVVTYTAGENGTTGSLDNSQQDAPGAPEAVKGVFGLRDTLKKKTGALAVGLAVAATGAGGGVKALYDSIPDSPPAVSTYDSDPVPPSSITIIPPAETTPVKPPEMAAPETRKPAPTTEQLPQQEDQNPITTVPKPKPTIPVITVEAPPKIDEQPGTTTGNNPPQLTPGEGDLGDTTQTDPTKPDPDSGGTVDNPYVGGSTEPTAETLPSPVPVPPAQ